ncbi:MAG: cytochrome c-type biogenesis protein CcmH [Marivita sp.]|uniref:cytochrome c-type biogenesis protein n=1 Tax=Marivita sp. TaxID=2003365 RepID=UPI0025BA8554|nr:cytochrome c-type biogenesis protein [Marivita sp.]MCI5111080.1 cytochrome c-type biogenesis protein CcmH [Marivita sp.]
MTVVLTPLRLLVLVLCLAVALPVAGPAYAVLPDEVLDDPVLENRARELSKGLRCLVCQNESIDESHADLARELRLVVRERLVAGDSDEEVLDYLVERYGEFVLLRPRTDGWNMILWLSGPALFLLALGIGVAYVRGRASAAAPTEAGLSEEEKARLEELLKQS